jgi:hypothetical protein
VNDCDAAGSTGTLAVKPLGTSCPEGGSGCSSWRIVAARREDRLQKTSRAETSKGRSGDAPLGYSGRRALRREQCNVDGQSGVFTVHVTIFFIFFVWFLWPQFGNLIVTLCTHMRMPMHPHICLFVCLFIYLDSKYLKILFN